MLIGLKRNIRILILERLVLFCIARLGFGPG